MVLPLNREARSGGALSLCMLGLLPSTVMLLFGLTLLWISSTQPEPSFMEKSSANVAVSAVPGAHINNRFGQNVSFENDLIKMCH